MSIEQRNDLRVTAVDRPTTCRTPSSGRPPAA